MAVRLSPIPMEGRASAPPYSDEQDFGHAVCTKEANLSAQPGTHGRTKFLFSEDTT